MSKYNNILTMFLVILIVAILAIIGYFVYDTLYSERINNKAQTAIEEFESATKTVKRNKVQKDSNTTTNEVTNTDQASSSLDEIANLVSSNNEVDQQTTVSSEEPEKVYYEGYEIKGRIQIPATKVDYPVLENATKRALEVAVGIAHGPGLNQVGNTTIYGHNYRNGNFFSNNKKLKQGDKILITDQYGEEVTYIIYNIYQADENDADYMVRDTEGRREISLQTCTDDSKARIIIWAAEEGSMQ